MRLRKPAKITIRILQEREPQGFDAGGEVMYTYSSILRPPTHKVRMLPVAPLPDETDHQSEHYVKECGHSVCQFIAD
jgi:hypothetical protein